MVDFWMLTIGTLTANHKPSAFICVHLRFQSF